MTNPTETIEKDEPTEWGKIIRGKPRPLHYVEYALVVVLFGFLRLLGPDRASNLGGRVTRFIGPRLKKVSQRAVDNLQIAFPDWSDEKIAETVGDVWENLGRTAAEYAHLDCFQIRGDDPRLVGEGHATYYDIIDKGEQAILVTGHFANWEVSGIVASQLGVMFDVIVRTTNNPLIDRLIMNKRNAVVSCGFIPKGLHGASDIVRALKAGRSLAILGDQKQDFGVPAPFFGRDAMTAHAPARFALKYNLPVIPISTERLGPARYKVVAHSPIDFTPSGDMNADIHALTVKINEALESFIRARPGEWLWLHRRWAMKGAKR
ncbi:MAG: lysophospholipid acyltransferase family protein [Pseudomonadota bacterium]